MKNSTIAKLNRMNACNEAVIWLKEQVTYEQAWADCSRGDWMLWLLGKLSGEPESDGRKLLVTTACKCARLSLSFAKIPTILVCIETTERWARGEATIEEVKVARKVADADADAYYADAAVYAAYTAFVADASASAAFVAFAASEDSDVRKEILAQCADIVRVHYPTAPVL